MFLKHGIKNTCLCILCMLQKTNERDDGGGLGTPSGIFIHIPVRQERNRNLSVFHHCHFFCFLDDTLLLQGRAIVLYDDNFCLWISTLYLVIDCSRNMLLHISKFRLTMDRSNWHNPAFKSYDPKTEEWWYLASLSVKTFSSKHTRDILGKQPQLYNLLGKLQIHVPLKFYFLSM